VIPQLRAMRPSVSIPGALHMPSFSLLGALEFRSVVASLRTQSNVSALNIFESPITPFPGGHYHRSSVLASSTSSLSLASVSHRHSSEVNPWDASLGMPLSERRSREDVNDLTPLPRRNSSYVSGSSTPTDLASSTLSHPPANGVSPRAIVPTKPPRIRSVLKRMYHVLFPSLHGFKSKSLLGKLAALFSVPALFAITVTLPVVITPYLNSHDGPEKPPGGLIDGDVAPNPKDDDEFEEALHDMQFSKYLTATQCLLAPILCWAVLFSSKKHALWYLLVIAIIAAVTASLVLVFADRGNDPAARLARCFMGFGIAVVWIMAIADEVVSVLQTVGHIFGLSDAIIGLTIFAVGNSMADFVADTSVASFAPVMAFSACFGGPMLNMLLGVGVSGTYLIHQTGQPFTLHFSSTLLVSTVGLLSLLIATMIFVPLNNYKLTKRWGIFLIVSYFVIMAVNIVVELKHV